LENESVEIENSLLLTPGCTGEAWGKAECSGRTKARRWWEQSRRTLRLGISLRMKMGSRRLTGKHAKEAFSCRRMQAKSNHVRLN